MTALAHHLPPAWIFDATPRLLRVAARGRVGVRVGATDASKTAPLLAEPLIVTHDNVMQYISTIGDLITCLDRDARGNLITQNPGKLHADASNGYIQASKLDGCTDYYFNCPRHDDDGILTDPLKIAATKLRDESTSKELAALDLDKRAAARGLKNDAAGNAQVNAEIAFYTDLRALDTEENRTYTEVSSASVASTAEWRKVQALDIRYQALRARYIALGFTPSCAVPDFAEKSFPWGWIVAGVLVLGGLILAGPLIAGLVFSPARS